MSETASKMAPISANADIEIELATRPVLRLWEGREKTPSKHGILGIPGFSKIMRGMEQSIREDDPYADYHYHTIEQAIDDLGYDLDNELSDIQTFLDENVPTAMRLPDVSSKNPVLVPVRFASRQGFQLVYQLLKVDQIILKILMASHIGLLSNKDKFTALARIEKRVRRVLHMAFAYRHTGVTRDDVAANNQKARLAKEAMGELEPGYLDGSVRSGNAPTLPMKRLQALGKVQVSMKTSSDPEKENVEMDNDLQAELDRVLLKAGSSKSAAVERKSKAASV